MVVLDEITIDIQPADVLAHPSLGTRRDTPLQLETLIPEVLSTAAELDLLSPAIAYDYHPIGAFEHARSIVDLVGEAVELAAVVVTIGPALDAAVGDRFATGSTVEGFLLDVVGTMALSQLCDRAEDALSADAQARRLGLSGALSPGGPGFDLAAQETLLRLAGAHRIGVTLTSAGMMMPLKSVSMAFGLGVGLTCWTRADSCRRCPSFDSCRYRPRDTS